MWYCQCFLVGHSIRCNMVSLCLNLQFPNRVKHLSICLFVICISYLIKYLFSSSACFHCLPSYCWLVKVVCVFWIQYSIWYVFWKTFPFKEVCLFILLRVLLAEQKFLILMESTYYFFLWLLILLNLRSLGTWLAQLVGHGTLDLSCEV